MYVDPNIERYVIALLAATHGHPRIAHGIARDRASQMIDAASEVAHAAGRAYVTPTDVKQAAPALLREWIVVANTTLPTERDDVIASLLDLVAVP